MGLLPPLVLEETYGDVAVPGSATVRLASGEVDVTLRSVGPTDEPSMPPLSMRISGPDGISRPEVRRRSAHEIPDLRRQAGAGMGGADSTGGRLPRRHRRGRLGPVQPDAHLRAHHAE